MTNPTDMKAETVALVNQMLADHAEPYDGNPESEMWAAKEACRIMLPHCDTARGLVALAASLILAAERIGIQ